MAAEYDENGEYKYPEGFDPETNEWLEGFEKQREEWENRYAEAERRHKMHTAQIEKGRAAAAEAAHADMGARDLLRARRDQVQLVDCTDLDDGADLDLPEDLRRLDVRG